MRRFWIDRKFKTESAFSIQGEVFKHICQVSRMSSGAKFELLTGDGKAYFCELAEIRKKEASAIILESRELPELKRPYIDLYLSVPKLAKLEWILEKAVELGVRSLIPVFSDYSFTKNPKILEDKRDRLNRIIEAAARQSARGTKLELAQSISLDAALKKINQTDDLMGLFAYEGDSKLGLKQALAAPQYQSAGAIAVLVGSEGGFSTDEVASCKEHGLDPVSLGDQVLRVETACVTLVSVLKYEMELFG